ncbi:hypothetical protein ACVWWN_005541 [Mycobacterium sp. URHB0021]
MALILTGLATTVIPGPLESARGPIAELMGPAGLLGNHIITARMPQLAHLTRMDTNHRPPLPQDCRSASRPSG